MGVGAFGFHRVAAQRHVDRRQTGGDRVAEPVSLHRREAQGAENLVGRRHTDVGIDEHVEFERPDELQELPVG